MRNSNAGTLRGLRLICTGSQTMFCGRNLASSFRGRAKHAVRAAATWSAPAWGVPPILRQLDNKSLLTRSGRGERKRRVMPVSEVGYRLNSGGCASCFIPTPSRRCALRQSPLMDQPYYARDYLFSTEQIEELANYRPKFRSFHADARVLRQHLPRDCLVERCAMGAMNELDGLRRKPR